MRLIQKLISETRSCDGYPKVSLAPSLRHAALVSRSQSQKTSLVARAINLKRSSSGGDVRGCFCRGTRFGEDFGIIIPARSTVPARGGQRFDPRLLVVQ